MRWHARRLGQWVVAAFLAVLSTPLACRNGREAAVQAPLIEHIDVVGQPAEWTTLPAIVSEKRRLWCLETVDRGARLRVVWGAPQVVEDIEIPSGERRAIDLDPGVVAAACPRTSPDGTWAHIKKFDHRRNPVLAIEANGRIDARYLALGSLLAWLNRGPGVLYTYDGTHLAIVSPNLSAALLPSLPVSSKALSATSHGYDATAFSVLYQTDAGSLIASYDEQTSRILRLHQTPSAKFLVWHQSRQCLQLQIEGAAPAWAELESANRLRRLGTFRGERITHAAFATAGLVLATVAPAGEARIRIIPNDL